MDKTIAEFCFKCHKGNKLDIVIENIWAKGSYNT